MQNRMWSVFLLVLSTLVSSCQMGEKNQEFRRQFGWLSGKWLGQNGSVVLTEQWRWNKTRFEGEGFEIEGGDTLFSEKIILQEIDGIPAYIVSIPFQGLVLYTGVSDSTKRWIFENKEHSFPSRIFYLQESDSSIIVSLEARDQAFRGEHSYQLKRAN